MISTRAVARCIIVLAVAAFIRPAPSYAETVEYVSPTGSGFTCSAALPCANLNTAFSAAGASVPGAVIRVLCLGGPAVDSLGVLPNNVNETIDVDCPQGFTTSAFLVGSNATNITVRLRHLGFRQTPNFSSVFQFLGSGTLILEDCEFTDATTTALDIEPNGPLNVVIRNSRISNGINAAILLKPGAGGSIKATFDHVVVTGNNGGGIKTDSTNGVVNLDVTESEISNNAANGIIAIGGASQNVVSIKNSVIARNGQAGVVSNGANAGVLVSTTLLDQNAAGATLVSGGNLFTYGNNDIVGSIGSGFTATALLH